MNMTLTLAPIVSPVRLRCECCLHFFLGYDSDICPDCASDPEALAELAKRQPKPKPQAVIDAAKARQLEQKREWNRTHREHCTAYHREYNRRRRAAKIEQR